jgi:hypothetical protein
MLPAAGIQLVDPALPVGITLLVDIGIGKVHAHFLMPESMVDRPKLAFFRPAVIRMSTVLPLSCMAASSDKPPSRSTELLSTSTSRIPAFAAHPSASCP